MPAERTEANLDDVREALAASRERYDALVQRAGFGVYRSTLGGRFLEVNAILVAMLGYSSSDEMLQLRMAEDVYLDPDDRPRLIEESAQIGFQDWFITRWKRQDGSPLNVRLSVRAITDADGVVTSFEGVVDDVTERQRQEELLRRSERMASLGTTLAGVAHELNNPLAAIMGFTQLLLKKPWPAEDRAALETVSHEATRSATIVKDLLALARKREVERRGRTDVNDLVGYIVRTRRYSLETTGVRCVLELDPTLPRVLGDRSQLEQVVLNLLSNAEQALRHESERTGRPVQGQVRVRTRHDDRDVIIEVEDNGPGIPESSRSRIWDPFWTTKREGEGTGLGLAVVHGIVSEHGGSITVTNAPDHGAHFVVRIPIAKSPASATSTGHAKRPLDVLVVDPGAPDLTFVERFLTSRGHAVINASSGELALRLAGQTSFDAVLCDAALRVRDGRTVATMLRGTPGCSSARFVLSSAGPVDERAPATADADAYVARPYDVEELRRLIEGD
jgi:PAS domain S-box-containing protein